MTDDKAKTATAPAPAAAAEPDETTFARLTRRMQHVYHTRVRTTTVVLILVWLALLVFYGFSSQHYAPVEPEAPKVTREEPAQHSTVPEVTTTSHSVPPSATYQPTTGQSETRGPGTSGEVRETTSVPRTSVPNPQGTNRQGAVPQAPSGSDQDTSVPGPSTGR